MMEVPNLECALAIEKNYTSSNVIHSQTTEVFKSALLSLARNEFKEIILIVDCGRGRTKRFKVKQEDLTVFRKFVKEGKCSIRLASFSMTLMISNAPPHALVQFLKCLAAKLAGNFLHEKETSSRKKLLSVAPNLIEGISPITQKDVNNLKISESGSKGLLKMAMSPLNSGRTKKRTRLKVDDKENPIRSPLDKKSSSSYRAKLGLTSEQENVLKAIKDGQNVFFTGGAGTGKSYLIHKIIGALPPDCTSVTASTGVAAFQIGGTTLHSFAGIGIGTAPLEQCCEIASKRKSVASVWKKCKHLVIDEVSMVDGTFFEKLEAVARHVKNNDKPFGGIQLILAGDFFQLPPVSKQKKKFFCFETDAWQKSIHLNIELTQVKRQTDSDFVKILQELRKGICKPATTAILKATAHNNLEKNGLLATKLCTHSDEVTKINNQALTNLKGELRKFCAFDSDPNLVHIINNHCPVEQTLSLKIGAQVMLMKNCNIGLGLVNGARGCVKAFAKVSGNPLVKFVSGHTEEITPDKWVIKGPNGIILTRKQLPLRLAWAFSIHKSQGMTLDCVEMSLRRVFESGQAYVALSRVKDLDSVKITTFDPSCIIADAKVLKFYQSISYTEPNVLKPRPIF